MKGRIVLGNAMPAFDAREGTGYGDTVGFRLRGPKMAAEKGAVAVSSRLGHGQQPRRAGIPA